MLVPVAQHQTRFVVPGLAVDVRGVAVGREAALVLPGLDRVISALRTLAAGSGLEDLFARLEVHRARSSLGSMEFVARFPVVDVHLLDRVGEVAALHGGELLTGEGRHFVRHRDRRSPLGYDVDRLAETDADLVLYGRVAEGGYRVEESFPLKRLLLRLAPEPSRAGNAPSDPALLLVPRGLRAHVERLLWRRRIEAEVARVVLDDDTDAYLYRLHRAPAPTLGLLGRTPGLLLLDEVGDRAAVEHGFEHPFDLFACGGALDEGRLFLFEGHRPGARVVDGPLVWLPLRAAVRPEAAEVALPARAATPGPETRIALHLVPDLAAGGPPEAVLVPHAQLGALRALVHRMSSAALARYRAASLEEGLLLLSDGPADEVPLGTPLRAFGERIYVPVGHTFLPRLPPELVGEALGAEPHRRTFFARPDRPPFSVEEAALVPLTRAFLARIDVVRREPERVEARIAAPEVVYEPSGARPRLGTGRDGEGR